MISVFLLCEKERGIPLAVLTVQKFLKEVPLFCNKPVIYFFGDEPFLIDEAIRRLQKEIVGSKANDFNFSKFFGDEIESQVILNSSDTLAFGAPRRMVLVKRSDAFSAKQLEKFLPYLKNPNSETSLVFQGGIKIDSRRKFFKRLGKLGLLVSSERLKGKDLHLWLQWLAKRRGHRLEKDALEWLEILVGSSLYAQDQAIERLSLYMGEKGCISGQVVRDTLSDTNEGILWSLTDALAEGKASQAFLALKRLFRQKETASPILILGTLANFFRRLLFIRLAKDLDLSDHEITKGAQISPGALFFNKKTAMRFSIDTLKRILQELSMADRRLKSSGLAGELILYDMVSAILISAKEGKKSNSSHFGLSTFRGGLSGLSGGFL